MGIKCRFVKPNECDTHVRGHIITLSNHKPFLSQFWNHFREHIPINTLQFHSIKLIFIANLESKTICILTVLPKSD